MLEFKFEEVALSPENWFDKAEELEYSAKVLLNFEKTRHKLKREFRTSVYIDTNVYVFSQVVMLYGFAIENLLKGFKCKRNKIQIDNLGKIKHLNHNLTELIEELNIEIDEVYKNYIKKIERHILWEGRYPSPKGRKDFQQTWTDENIDKWHNTYVLDFDERMLKDIYSKIYTKVNEELFGNNNSV
jgi:hypothetical protein